MNKKKILSLCLVLCLAATAIIGGTMAYFSDSDFNRNVMVTGNVKIDQIEEERTEDGTALKDFEDGKKLVPYVGDPYDGYDSTLPEYGSKVFDTADNAIDKIVTVKNTGTEEAYVRTLFAFEMEVIPDDPATPENEYDLRCPVASKYNDAMLVCEAGLNNKGIILKGDTDTDNEVIIEIDGVYYRVGEYYYRNESKLAAGETTHPSMTQIYLAPKMGNEWYDYVGETYDILVLSQATQTQGFEDAKDALYTAFGDINEMYKTEEGKAKLTEWFANTASRDISADPVYLAD